MRSFAAGKIDVYFGPTELGAPDDLEQAIVDFIDGATSSLDIAVQEIDSMMIAEAIINARWRGVNTSVFVEQDYIRSKLKDKPDSPVPDVAAGETQQKRSTASSGEVTRRLPTRTSRRSASHSRSTA